MDRVERGSTMDVGVAQSQVEGMRQALDAVSSQLAEMQNSYKSVLAQMADYQRGMFHQDALMQSLIAYILQRESGGCFSS